MTQHSIPAGVSSLISLQVKGLLRDLGEKAERRDLGGPVRNLLARAEILLRRVDLCNPLNEAEIRAAVSWMAERGEAEDLALIEEVRKSGRSWPRDMEELFRTTLSRISAREHASPASIRRSVIPAFRGQRSSDSDRMTHAVAELNAFIYEEVKEFLRRLTREAPARELLRPIADLLARAEIVLRRVELTVPADEDEFQAALFWVTENAAEQDDLGLLRELQQSPPFSSDEIQEALETAVQRVRQRVYVQECKNLLARLLQPGNADRADIAEQLAKRGVWRRGSIHPRGTLTNASELDENWPKPEDLSAFAQLLDDPDPELRVKVASALGEWGGEKEAGALHAVLQKRLGSAEDEQLQFSCITALQTIGGPVAVAALRAAAERGVDDVRMASLNALETLATDGGSHAGAPASVLRTLQRISEDPKASRRARLRARELLEGAFDLRASVVSKLQNPGCPEDFEAVLFWLAQHGSKDQWPVLRQILRSSPFQSEQVRKLLVRATSRAEADECISRLLQVCEPNRRVAAEELYRLGQASRGDSRPRGSLTAAADARLPGPNRLAEMVHILTDEPDSELRAAVALALSEWGGGVEGVAIRKALEQAMRGNQHEALQRSCIAALRTIGGLGAVEGLSEAAQHGSEAMRLAALDALRDLAAHWQDPDTSPAEAPFGVGLSLLKTARAVAEDPAASQPVLSRAKHLLSEISARAA